MTEASAFLKAIPDAASSPLALAAYLATVISWAVIAWRVKRFRILMERIRDLPEPDRLPAIQLELGRVSVPAGLNPEQYLRSRIHGFLFMGFLAVCAMVVVIFAMAGYRMMDQKDRSDGLIGSALGNPPSEFMSAFNVLSNGAQMVKEAADRLRPSPAKDELAEQARRLAQQGLKDAALTDRLAEIYGRSQLRHVNEVLARAAHVVDSQFDALTDCYRRVECRNGARSADMCRVIKTVINNITAANEAAKAVPRLTFNTSGDPLLIGGGALDIEFNAIVAGNIALLARGACSA